MAYRVYITDALKIISENSAKFAGGSMISARFYDIINEQNKHDEKKTGEEIVADIITRAGLEVA